MSEKLLIIHGYSDGSTSFTALRDFFVEEAGFAKDDVYLLDYASMDDEATFRDFADKLDADYTRFFKGERINVACHSTGALVVRAWLALRRVRQRELKQATDCPVKRILMFVPANFGSDLANLGRSFLGKFRSTFFNSHAYGEDFMESGKVVLQGLEPASPFQWGLSEIDLENEDYFAPQDDPDKMCFPFVFAAGRDYDGELQARIIKKRKKPGTDGTVRICGTSLNIRKCTIAFLQDGEPPEVMWHRQKKFSAIPFAVFKDLNHGTIIAADEDPFNSDLGPKSLVLSALKGQSLEDYQEQAKQFQKMSNANYAAMKGRYKSMYQQFFFKVRDDTDRAVPDFFIDFFVLNKDGSPDLELTERFDTDFESQFYTHSADSSCRVLMINCRKARSFLSTLKAQRAKLVFDIEAGPPLPNIKYQKGYFEVFDGANDKSEEDNQPSFIYPNTTTLLDIVLNRRQSSKLIHLVDHDLKALREKRARREEATGRGRLLTFEGIGPGKP